MSRLEDLELAKTLMANGKSSGYRVTIEGIQHGETIIVGSSRRAIGRLLKTDIEYEQNGQTFEGLD